MSEEDLKIVVHEDGPDSVAKREKRLSLSIPKTLSLAMKNAWYPIPVPKPEVDPELPHLPAIQRSAEVLRYQMLQLEFAISPEGGLRGWLKLNILLALLMGIPALFLVPIITFIISSFAS